tara:strand:+ start:1173 stop:1502 length:330 start_codon:yes stop_codon:yes gene_type:complete
LAEKITYGPLDPETQTLFETVLNLAQRYADLQMDDETYEDLQRDIDELAQRFEVERSEVEIEIDETEEQDGNKIVKIKFKPQDRKTLTQDQLRKTLRVISNDTEDDNGE